MLPISNNKLQCNNEYPAGGPDSCGPWSNNLDPALADMFNRRYENPVEAAARQEAKPTKKRGRPKNDQAALLMEIPLEDGNAMRMEMSEKTYKVSDVMKGPEKKAKAEFV